MANAVQTGALAVAYQADHYQIGSTNVMQRDNAEARSQLKPLINAVKARPRRKVSRPAKLHNAGSSKNYADTLTIPYPDSYFESQVVVFS